MCVNNTVRLTCNVANRISMSLSDDSFAFLVKVRLSSNAKA